MRILIIGSHYASSSSANGICAQNIALEFKRQGHDVYVISTGLKDILTPELIEGVKVWTVKIEWFNQLLGKLRKGGNWYHRLLLKPYWALRSLYILPRYPITQPIRLERSYKLALKIIKEEGIDVVLCTCLPYEPIAVGMRLKEKLGDSIRVVTYHLDILSFPNNKERLLKAYKERRIKNAIEKELHVVDKMLVPESGKGIFSNSKIEYTGFPAYIEQRDAIRAPFEFDKKYINISFIGSLDKSNRSPRFALDFLEKLADNRSLPIRISIWGNISDADTKRVVDECRIAKYYGMLENRYVNDILSKTDVLLNISNAVLYNLIPSKIFQLFDSNRPILNIVNHPNDLTIPYFEQADGVLNVMSYQEQKEDDVFDFISSCKKIAIKRSRIEQYSASFICKQILSK